MRTLYQALVLGIAINGVAWVLIFLTLAEFPRYIIGPGFALAWFAPAPVGEVGQYLILFDVNLTLWSLLAFLALLGVKAWMRPARHSLNTPRE